MIPITEQELQERDLLYRMAAHIRNTDNMPLVEWGVRGIELLAELRCINEELYDQKVKLCKEEL